MSQTTPSTAGHLAVVLVHGAFADASSWTGVIERLQKAGVQVTAPANPLRGLSSDSAYIASVFDQIPGPVLAVGHSYGGALITNAATTASNVVGLVYVAAFATDEGERLGDVESNSKDSVLNTALVPLHYPTGQGAETAVEFAINPAHFHEAFAADLPAEQAAVMAATQRTAAELAFSEPSGVPAWKTLPAWAVVASGDKAAGSDVIRSMARRAGATITEVEGSHGLHDLAATGRYGRDPERGRRRRLSGWAAAVVSWSLPEPRGATYADRYRRPEWCIGTSPTHPSI